MIAGQPPTYPRHARHLVINEGRHMELEHAGVLGYDVSCGTVDFVSLELVVGLDDVGQFVGEIIL